MLWIIVFLRALRPNDLCSAKNNTRLVGGHSSFKASHHMVHQKQIKYSTLIQYNLSNKTDEYVTKITKNRSTVSDQKLKSLSMICGHGYTGLWPSWRPWWYLKGAPIWTRAPDWPSLWSLWMTVCHPMLGCFLSWFCSVPQLKTPSQCLHLNGETPGPAWRWLANPNPNPAQILSLLSPMENAPRTQWKNIPCFLINIVSIL